MTTATSSRPGLTFCPSERDLTDLYLHGMITGEALPAGTERSIHVADVYSTVPEKLVEGFDEAPGTGKGNDNLPVWYFFSPVRYVGGHKTTARGNPARKARRIDCEAGKHWWHSEKGEMPVEGGSNYGGYEQYFSYKVKNASTGKDERAGWIMSEYGISPEHGGGDLVLCKIHRSPRTGQEDEVPVSAPIVSSKKRKAAERHEELRASARPRHTVDQDEHQRKAAASTAEAAMTPEDFAEHHRHAGDELIFEEDPMAEFQKKFPLLFDHQHTDQLAAPPSSFIQNVEQDFCSSYQHDVVMPLGDLTVSPCCAPAAQPEDADAAGLFQGVAAEEAPRQNYNDDGQMEARLGEEQQDPEKTAADEVIYGTISRCSDDMMQPWQSTSSVPMMFGMY